MNPVFKMALVRFLLDLLLFFALFYWYWWFVLLLAFVAAVLMPNFIEFIILGYLLDLFYSVPRQAFFGFQWYATLLTLLLFIFIRVGKSSLRIYDPWSKNY